MLTSRNSKCPSAFRSAHPLTLSPGEFAAPALDAEHGPGMGLPTRARTAAVVRAYVRNAWFIVRMVAGDLPGGGPRRIPHSPPNRLPHEQDHVENTSVS